jgi:predicted nucleic acid-binding protein
MIVSNSTPISNLLHIKHVHLLQKLFKKVHIPDAVADELNVFFKGSHDFQDCLNNNHIIIKSVESVHFVTHMTPYLHKGEIEAICLSLENGAVLCLMDDKDGREVAQMNQLPVTGTLGILLKAKSLGYISEVKPLIDLLRSEKHFWIDEHMYKKVLSLAGERVDT